MNIKILLCTVGGSHEPILKAICSTKPDYVCFFCTGQDPVTGRQGSIVQVTGRGKVIKASRDDEKPSLPNIPAQADLTVESCKAVEVPADNLDGAWLAMRKTIADLVNCFPDADFVADYTGGTKTMTAALVLAALESDSVELQLVSGARPDLKTVKPGSEQAMSASVASIRLNRDMQLHLAAWGRFAYREAATGLDAIPVETNSPDWPRLSSTQALSHALALWDDFDHERALEKLEGYERYMGNGYLPNLRLLTQTRKPGNQPARLFDLWLNAQRRAAQGRHDDAVARVYRLLEWCAQWQLESKMDIVTADLPANLAPAGVSPGRDGKISVGLRHAWQVVREQLDGPGRKFIEQYDSELLNWLEVRNKSILAHGFRPVKRSDWEETQRLVKKRFLPVLLELAQEVGVREMPEQLPTAFPQITLPD